ncbi:MAG: translation initiation factor IF-3 [Puniceicoccales bacterium]|jgi:translation initiation factor IF-3|nr:translation initiation factor IF-3 [Puniceicoccales bacterium]
MVNAFPKKPSGKKKDFGRSRFDRGPRRNERIRVPEVRVIGSDGAQLGVMATRDALAQARALGLDLIEVAATVNPPVCRILDYGKFKYDEEKKSKGQQKSNASKTKEVKFRPSVDVGDYNTKIRHGQEFLSQGFKLKLTLMFRGREMAHQELGFQVVERAIGDLREFGTADSSPRLAGRTISAMISPRIGKAKKRSPAEVVSGGSEPNGERPLRGLVETKNSVLETSSFGSLLSI